MHSQSKLLVQTRSLTLFSSQDPFRTELGGQLPRVDVAYETYGSLNSDGTNAILICHALTANAHAAGFNSNADKTPGWWDALIGPSRAFDTNRYFVVCPNILGSCYGTTGPRSIDPGSGQPYGPDFPRITVRDIVRVQKALLDTLGVQRLRSVAGSSLGGMQVLEWAIMYPEMCDTVIPISTAVAQPAWCVGLNAIAREAITGDPDWLDGRYSNQPARGLSLARMVGMMSYRSPEELDQRFGRARKNGAMSQFEIESYLQYQGSKLADRFDANTYLVLSHATDSHDVTFGRGDERTVLGRVSARTLSIGISSDVRYHPHLQKRIAHLIPGARYEEIESIHGHDAFLIEFEKLAEVIGSFLDHVGHI